MIEYAICLYAAHADAAFAVFVACAEHSLGVRIVLTMEFALGAFSHGRSSCRGTIRLGSNNPIFLAPKPCLIAFVVPLWSAMSIKF
jgi:hypothetical protein